MIGIDTNVLLRYLTQDDPVQSPIATAFIEQRLSPQEPGFISVVTIAEIACVLRTTHKLERLAIVSIIARLLEAATLVVEREREVFHAMRAVRKRESDFTDALIGAIGRSAGCFYSVTFDRRAARREPFVLLKR